MRKSFFAGPTTVVFGLILSILGSLLGSSALSAGTPAAAPALRIGGTGAVTALMQSLGADYPAGAKERLVVVPSLGTPGAIRAVIDGALDAAIISRPLTSDETASGLVTLETMRSPFGLVTSRQNPPGLGSGDVALLFGNEHATNWPDGFPLRLVLRLRSESDTALVAALFPGMQEAQEHARARSDIPVAATDQINADLAEQLEGSLTGASLTQIRMEKRPLSFVDINGVKPTLENLETGAYPYAKTMYLVAFQSRRSGADAFAAFLRSQTGRLTLRAGGVLLAPDS